MAISDIPEYVEVNVGDLIRAENWNNVQRQVRNGLRTHQHTRVPGAPANDARVTDDADQINTSEIADGAVTVDKLANASVTAAKLAPGAIGGANLGPNSVSTANLQNHSVTGDKLSFETVENGSLELGHGTAEVLVQSGAASTKTTVYFPTLTVTESEGSGISDVFADIAYRQSVGSNKVDVYIRITNSGTATAHIVWQVLTFG
jgi:hypothetical protein